MLKLARKLLILSHRYLGIAFSALIVMWFATGISMMYVGGMPRVTPEMRLERMTAIDPARIRLTPAEAAARAELAEAPARASLVSLLGRPVYRFGGGEPVAVFADTGEIAGELSRSETADIAARFMGVPRNQVRYVGTLTHTDQWTLGMGRQLPLHKYRIDTADGSELYVSPAQGEVVMLTTTRTRAFAWISTIPHWLYFEGLRDRQGLWYSIVVWTSGVACVVALLGLVLGVVQYRRGRPSLAAAVPYAGAMRWHYVTGVVFGVFTLTWSFSGLLSMEPFDWTNARGVELSEEALSGGTLDLAAYPPMDAAKWARLAEGAALKEIELVRMHDEPFYVVRRTVDEGVDLGKRERLHQPYYVYGRVAPDRVIVSATTLEPRTEPFPVDQIVARVQAAVPDARVADYELLTGYDSYYYSRNAQTPLPIVRIRFDDAAQTWLYIDPWMNQPLASIPRLARVERWLYNGLHSFDVGYLYTRPLWDIVMLVLLLGGLASSAIGLYLGAKRLLRSLVRGLPSQIAAAVPDAPVKSS